MKKSPPKQRFLLQLLVFAAVFFIIVYAYLYINTEFRHIFISTDLASNTTDDDNGGLSWTEILDGPLEPTNQQFIKYIRRNILIPPPQIEIPYNLNNGTTKDASIGQTQLVLKALNFQKNGFYIECGALDGETRSNTLLLERDYGWTGLLVEADPSNFELLKQKKRKSWTANVCLSTKSYPMKVKFKQEWSNGKILEEEIQENAKINGTNTSTHLRYIQVQCLPLLSLLLALNVSEIDYLSLDVEGAEIDILLTLPSNYLRNHVRVMSVEYAHSRGGRPFVRRWISSQGFRVYGEVTDPNDLANDWIFINNRE